MPSINHLFRKAGKLAGLLCIRLSPVIRPGLATTASVHFYGKWGMKFVGKPNYLSARINFDGTNYGLIEIHEGVTISSFVRVLTHDWSLFTIAKSMDHFSDKPIGTIRGVSIGAYSFVGTGSIIMPGAKIGRGCLIGAGTVVRGTIPNYSIVVGSPGTIVGDARDFTRRQLDKLGINHSLNEQGSAPNHTNALGSP